ncbi:MAG: SGNH/GDSL hydrolase family protein [Chromatiaceae bacterium]|jgi:acyl-CoA thioesterase-1
MQMKILRRITVVALSIWLSACGSGSTSAPDVVVPPEPTDPPFSNAKVSCGGFKVKLSQTLPWAVSPPSDWVVMGSSSAFGAGASVPEKSWVGLLKKSTVAATATIHNIARGGDLTYQALSSACVVSSDRPKTAPEHNFEKALEYKPDLVILSYPSNDIAVGYSVTEAAANLLLLRWQFAQKNIPVLVLSAQPRNIAKEQQAKLLELDSILRPLVGACYVDVYQQLVDAEGNLAAKYNAGDGVHLTDAGHQIVFDAVMQRISSRQCVSVN